MSKLIEDYYLMIKEKEGISFEECKKICTAPFLMTKEVMSKNIFVSIRLKYFGIFQISNARIKNHLNYLVTNKSEDDHYKNKIETLTKHLENETRSN